MIVMEKLNDMEYSTLCEMLERAWDKFNGRNERTAFKNCLQFCKRRGISEVEFWDWVND